MTRIDGDHPKQAIKRIFISYAKEDIAIAEKVDAFLREKGFDVFRDRRDIDPGEEIWLEINRALSEADALVLLASPATMPYHRESYREWLPFDLLQRPIYPLYLRDCTFFLRLMVYKYIDARTDLDRGLAELVSKFSGTFVKPEPMSQKEFEQIKSRTSADLIEYRLGRIAEWSLPRYQIDKRFVSLSLTLDRGENSQNRYEEFGQFNATDLRDVLEKTRAEHPVLVLLGKPGSGKSTLLRRLELDHCLDRRGESNGEISFLVSLNRYKSDNPMAWLSHQWEEQNPGLGSLQRYLEEGRVLLLLDALNEMPITQQASYEDLVGQWRDFAETWTKKANNTNRMIFSCRSLDYSVLLSSDDLLVPHLTVQSMDRDQVRAFINTYAPGYLELIEPHIEKDPRLLELYGTPYFLKLLCEVVKNDQSVPSGRAGLFTKFVRSMLIREMKKGNRLFSPGNLLHKFDCTLLNNNGQWKSPFDLPRIGPLIKQLNLLAFKMQSEEPGRAANEIQISYDEALGQIEYEKPQDILDAGISLSILDLKNGDEITFFHQLLQEYFAARRLAAAPKPELAHQEWRREQVNPRYEEVLKSKNSWEPAPPLPQSGWEETVVTAAPMADDPAGFIRNLIPHHLPLAARCADSAELVKVAEPQREALRRDLRDQLLRRMRDPEADLRARLAAGEALGALGHPEFERRSGKFGEFLLPPFETVPAGTYPFGKENQQVRLDGFQMGRYPVTNAEFAFFIDAGGYRDPQWWDTDAARKWLRESNPQAPGYWNNTRFNNPAQPVVAVTWYEARAYCNWLTASIGDGQQLIIRLPTEPEFEAAARGREGQHYPYGDEPDSRLCNTEDSGIGRPSPVGLFENRSPFGIYDLSGNVWEWGINEFENPLEDPTRIELEGSVVRPLRGGSWDGRFDTEAVFRTLEDSYQRVDIIGFRIVSVVRPPS